MENVSIYTLWQWQPPPHTAVQTLSLALSVNLLFVTNIHNFFWLRTCFRFDIFRVLNEAGLCVTNTNEILPLSLSLSLAKSTDWPNAAKTNEFMEHVQRSCREKGGEYIWVKCQQAETAIWHRYYQITHRHIMMIAMDFMRVAWNASRNKFILIELNAAAFKLRSCQKWKLRSCSIPKLKHGSAVQLHIIFEFLLQLRLHEITLNNVNVFNIESNSIVTWWPNTHTTHTHHIPFISSRLKCCMSHFIIALYWQIYLDCIHFVGFT